MKLATGAGRRLMMATAVVGVLAGFSGPAASAVALGPIVHTATGQQCTSSTRIPETPPALDQLQSAAAWELTRGGGITVAVVDSGVALNPHLDAAVVPGVNLVPDGSDPSGRSDTYGHGTVIAGQIAAQAIAGSGVIGLAPEARILPVRVYAGVSDQEVEAGFGPNAGRIAEGIRTAADRGAQIINVSMSTSAAEASLADAVSYATARGSLVVASSGNRDSTLALQTDEADGARYPAGFADAVGVAATDTTGVVTDASIHGPHVRLAAPGQTIPSASALGGDCVVADSAPATSYATAYVSAAAALVAATHPTETPAQWAYRLEATAVRTDPGSRSDTAGWGVVQPYDAMVLVPGAGLRGPQSPFTTGTVAGGSAATAAPVDIVVGPGPDAAAIVTATAIGVSATVALAAIGAMAIFVSRRRDDDAPARPAPTGRGLYRDDTPTS